MSKKTKGFTLIEISIVLIIIGILTGAVVKGLSLIDDARQSNMQQSLQSLTSAYLTYIKRYLAPPGDDANATDRFGANSTNGDGNGVIDNTNESSSAWNHLRQADLLTGSGTTAPRHPWGGDYQFIYHTLFNRNTLCLLTVPGKQAQILDSGLDDGVPTTGNLRTETTADTYQDGTNYTVCTPM